MENLGHYLLSRRIALPGGSVSGEAWSPGANLEPPTGNSNSPADTILAYEGQDVRTGISVLVFKPLEGEPPKTGIPNTLSWVEGEKPAWISEIPMGSVQVSLLAGRVEPQRLLNWTKQLLQVVKAAEDRGVAIGWITPDLVWARGSKVWLGGVGIESPHQKLDYAGLLETIRTIAGDAYPALPWREALEQYVSGEHDYGAVMEKLESILEQLEIPAPQQEVPPAHLPEPKPPRSKDLKVQVGESEALPAAPNTPPKRIRIDEGINPPFAVLEPSQRIRRNTLIWLIVIPLILLGAGLFYFLRPKPQGGGTPTTFPVEFRLQPPGPTASIEVLEGPEDSKLPLNTILAEVPGRVEFDKAGVYRIRVRVQGRAPVESIIEVPNPAGVTISLQ